MKLALPRIVIGGLAGGCGKTFLAAGIVRALRDRGLRVSPFKKGPDYIDAAWLSRAAGTPCRNLDVHLAGERPVVASLAAHGGGVAILEGARGLFDAMDDAGTTSTATLARLLSAPVVLVVDCTKVTRTVASLIYGCQKTDRRVRIAGVVLNRIGNPRHEANIRSAIADLCGLPVLGAVPRTSLASLPERHLGLVMPDEHDAADESLAAMAQAVARHVDLDALLGIAATAPALSVPAPSRGRSTARPLDRSLVRSRHRSTARPLDRSLPNDRSLRIGVVRDSAFSFYYPENLEALEACGGTLVPLSATADRALPEVDALYIGGGFPETHGARLAANPGFAASLRAAVEDGLPVYAECGGAVYVGRSVRVGDTVWPMAGILPLDYVLHRTPQGHGYTELEATKDNPFFPAGVRLRGHEFHYTAVAEWPRGLAVGFRVLRGRGFDGAGDGVRYKNLLAVYSHVHASGAPEWAAGIVARAARFAETRAARRARPARASSPSGDEGAAVFTRSNALEGA